MKYRIHEPDFLGDHKIDLIDYLCEQKNSNLNYSSSFVEIYGFVCKLFGVPIQKITKNKAKKLFGMLFVRNDFSKESFIDCCSSAIYLNDQADLIRARQMLSKNEYFDLIGNFSSNSTKDELMTIVNSKVFYQSPEWKRIRYQALRIYKNFCQCCGRKRSENLQLHVDHIIPKSAKPELALNISNLQILCSECNEGKSNIDSTDWRDKQSYKV